MDYRLSILIILWKWQPYLSFHQCVSHGDVTSVTARFELTHWGRVTHICVGKLTIIGSDNGLSPDRRQAIIWTNDGLLLIVHLETNFSEILIETLTFSFKKMRLTVSSGNWRAFCLGLNVLSNVSKPKQSTGLWDLFHSWCCVHKSQLNKLSCYTTYCSIHKSTKIVAFNLLRQQLCLEMIKIVPLSF